MISRPSFMLIVAACSPMSSILQDRSDDLSVRPYPSRANRTIRPCLVARFHIGSIPPRSEKEAMQGYFAGFIGRRVKWPRSRSRAGATRQAADASSGKSTFNRASTTRTSCRFLATRLRTGGWLCRSRGAASPRPSSATAGLHHSDFSVYYETRCADSTTPIAANSSIGTSTQTTFLN
jgi:hypothetical protein